MELPILNLLNFGPLPILRYLFPHVWTWTLDGRHPTLNTEAAKKLIDHPVPMVVMSNDYEYNDLRSLYIKGKRASDRIGGKCCVQARHSPPVLYSRVLIFLARTMSPECN